MTTSPSGKTARLHQRIKVELKLKLQREAERRHLDETSIVTIALAEYFEKHGDPPPTAEERETSREATRIALTTPRPRKGQKVTTR